ATVAVSQPGSSPSWPIWPLRTEDGPTGIADRCRVMMMTGMTTSSMSDGGRESARVFSILADLAPSD
ncbi:hypothetical protein BMR86_25855, partial [Stenotrophomonas sp. KAs 5-3]